MGIEKVAAKMPFIQANPQLVGKHEPIQGTIEMTRRAPRIAAAIIAFLLSVLLATPARPAQEGIELLSTYIGEWSGESVLQGGETPKPFRCRLTISKGNQAKINYSGRCTLVNTNISVAGTIAYDAASRRYQAVMSSNAGFSGYAVGVQKGENITFDLAEKETDRGGNDVRIGARIELTGEAIVVDFELEFNDSGEILTASVPFSR
jgi:hypothetical protein